MEQLIIGSHVSFKQKEQLLGSVKDALSYGGNTFMIYTGAPQNTKRVPLSQEKIRAAHKLMKEKKIDINNVIVHAPYIVNLAGRGQSYDYLLDFFKEEIKRVEALGLSKMVFHPGSHVKLSREEGIKNIISALNKIIESNQKVELLLETMAGKGTEIGVNFSELKTIIDGVKDNTCLKVCLDTCHLHDAGYDLSNFDVLLKEFDEVIGLERLACLHINDSLNESGSQKDRHANLGKGKIGFDILLKIIYHPLLKGIPKILETPFVTKDDDSKRRLYPPYKFEIEMIKKRIINPNLVEDIRNYYK